MKTRIKKITLKSGSIVYMPQYMCFFLWCDLCNTRTWDIEEAKGCIDSYFRGLEHAEARKIVKTEYIKYP